MKSGQESSEVEKVTGFRSRYTCVCYLDRNKSERGVRSFCFYSQCSFFWPSVILYPSFPPSVSFSFIRPFLLTHTCTIELEHDVHYIYSGTDGFLCFTYCSLSLTYFPTNCSFLIIFSFFFFLVYKKNSQICIVFCSLTEKHP